MTASAFQAAFADFKLIRGRKVAQIVLEVAIEAADAALETLGGVPRPDKETWVGVARIAPERASRAPPEPVKERRKFADLPMSQQAALRCDDLDFRTFLRSKNAEIWDANDAANVVRDLLGVKSRAEILPDTPAGRGWLELERQFKEWQRV